MRTDGDMAADFAMLGVAVELEETGEAEFAVLAENFEAVVAFGRLWTQWRFAAFGQRLVATGLDFAAVAALHKGRGGKRWQALSEALQVMELAALPLMNEGGD